MPGGCERHTHTLLSSTTHTERGLWQLQPSWRIVWPSSVPPAFAECLPLHPSNPSVGLAEGCQTPQPDGLQNDVRNLCHSQQRTHPCEELRINFTVGRGGRKLFLTDQEPHHGVPCANTSETPSVPTQIVQQLRLAGLPDSTLPWQLVVSALDQKVLSTWPMCVKRLPTLVLPLTIHQLAPETWRGQLSTLVLPRQFTNHQRHGAGSSLSLIIVVLCTSPAAD